MPADRATALADGRAEFAHSPPGIQSRSTILIRNAAEGGNNEEN
jgi:hypothetical protein